METNEMTPGASSTPLHVITDLDYQLPATDNPAVLREHRGHYLNAIIFDNEYRMRDFVMKELDEQTREMILSKALIQKSQRTERTRIIFISVDSLIQNPKYGVYHNGTMILSKQIIESSKAANTGKQGEQ